MTTVTYTGLPVSAYQKTAMAYNIQAKTSRLLSGDIHVQLSPKAQAFPVTFQCYTEDYDEIEDLAAAIGTFATLIIDNISFTSCYISELKDIKELILDSGKFSYVISFGKADFH